MATISATLDALMARASRFEPLSSGERRPSLQQGGGALDLLVHQAEQLFARGAQALRQHEDELHQQLGAEQRLLDDDAGEVFAVKHGDQRALEGNAGSKARLAV